MRPKMRLANMADATIAELRLRLLSFASGPCVILSVVVAKILSASSFPTGWLERQGGDANTGRRRIVTFGIFKSE
jgi:hypothetical protein